MKAITILGSTGSIGRQTLEVAEHLGYSIVALSALGSNLKLLKEQIKRHNPKHVAVYDEKAAKELTKSLNATTGTHIRSGMSGLAQVAGYEKADIIVTAIAGEIGLEPTLAAIRSGKRIALANKEPLVCAGETVMKAAQESGAEIIPVDSEHSAIFQCLAETRIFEKHVENTSAIENMTEKEHPSTKTSQTHRLQNRHVKKIILTASGGPFRGYTQEQLKKVTPKEALSHPNWNMGKKITIDSATLMNKGLELIEAMHLFDVSPDQIEVIIHPESIIHSMVEFVDGSTIAQLSNPDMKMPIQYALTYPERLPGLTKPLELTSIGSHFETATINLQQPKSLSQVGSLTFEKPDTINFPCLSLAYMAAKAGQKACAALNRANEEAVSLFLKGKIGFCDIALMIDQTMKNYTFSTKKR